MTDELCVVYESQDVIPFFEVEMSPSGWARVIVADGDETAAFTFRPDEKGIQNAEVIVKALQVWIERTKHNQEK